MADFQEFESRSIRCIGTGLLHAALFRDQCLESCGCDDWARLISRYLHGKMLFEPSNLRSWAVAPRDSEQFVPGDASHVSILLA
jgi:hypothetical protein